MHHDQETGEKVMNDYESLSHIKPHYDAMPQEKRDAIAVCILIGGLRASSLTYGFYDAEAVYLYHPGLKNV